MGDIGIQWLHNGEPPQILLALQLLQHVYDFEALTNFVFLGELVHLACEEGGIQLALLLAHGR